MHSMIMIICSLALSMCVLKYNYLNKGNYYLCVSQSVGLVWIFADNWYNQ